MKSIIEETFDFHGENIGIISVPQEHVYWKGGWQCSCIKRGDTILVDGQPMQVREVSCFSGGTLDTGSGKHSVAIRVEPEYTIHSGQTVEL